MATIKAVRAEGGMIEVHLENGSILMLSCAPMLEQERFAALAEDDRIYYPHTDGESIFWRDGPKLSVKEILQLLKQKEEESE